MLLILKISLLAQSCVHLEVQKTFVCYYQILFFSPLKKVQKSRSKDAFEDYQEKTDDAWDCTDDDLIEMNNFRISLKDVRSTALQVIRNHSQQRLSEQATELHSQNSLSSKPPGNENYHRGSVNGVPDLTCVNGETKSARDSWYSSSSSNNSGTSNMFQYLSENIVKYTYLQPNFWSTAQQLGAVHQLIYEHSFQIKNIICSPCNVLQQNC